MYHIRLDERYTKSWCGEPAVNGWFYTQNFHVSQIKSFHNTEFCTKCLQQIICSAKIVLRGAKK
jgi:hypothetical protein